jgi:hypothetical protein
MGRADWRTLLLVPGLVAGACLAVQARAQEGGQPQGTSLTPADQYHALMEGFHAAARAFSVAQTDDERGAAAAQAEALPPRLLELAEAHPDDPIALDALVQAVSQEARAIAILTRDHLRSDRLAEACRRMSYGFRGECETFLRTVLDVNPHRDVQAHACLRLAQFLNGRLNRLDLLDVRPEMAARYEALFGAEHLAALRRRDRGEAIHEIEALFERAANDYGDVPVPYAGTVGDVAQAELFAVRHLAVGRQAQEIEGQDQHGEPLKLSDYRGKVVLLYFWSEY